MEYDRHESARWALATNQEMDKYLEARDTILDDSAARGFPAVTGEGLSQLLVVGAKTKKALVEANGKLYDEERGRGFELTEFQLKLAVAVAKLAMELYREQILNQVSIEQTEEEVLKEGQRADVERLQAEIEGRQGAIITAKATAQQQVTDSQIALIAAERSTLGAETNLLAAQLATAEARLDIIAAIYEVIAAENLVLSAETARAAALEQVVTAEAEVAAIKQSMIPIYGEKAAAKTELAAAITTDAENRKAIENLGSQKNVLKLAEANAESAIKRAELSYEIAKDAVVRASDAVELSRTASRTTVQLAQTAARESAIGIRQGAEITRVGIRWQAELDHTLNRVAASLKQSGGQAGIIASELGPLLASINSVGVSEKGRVNASGVQNIFTEVDSMTYKYIAK